MPALAQRPPDLDATGQPIGAASGRPPDLDTGGLPVFRETNAKDASGNAIVSAATDQLQRTDLPDSVRKELEDIRDGKTGSGDEILNALTPQGAHAMLSGLLAPVRAWGDAGPHRVVTGIKAALGGQYAKGANDVIAGGLTTAAPMLAPAIMPAAIAAPGATALTVGAGAAAQAAAPPIARAIGATPDQADLAGTVAGVGAGAAIAKIGVPALARWSASRQALGMGRDYMQSTRDLQAALGPSVSAEDIHRARPFLETVHNDVNGIPIVGKEATGGAMDQLANAANVAKDEIEQHIAGIIQQFPDVKVPAPSSAVLRRVSAMPGSMTTSVRTRFSAAAQQVIADNELDQPMSLKQADDMRLKLNAENRAVLEGTKQKQRTAILANPEYVARQEAANQLRDGIYDSLEQQGVQGIRDLRLAEGSILKLRNAADPLTRGLRSESTVARTGKTSLARRLAQKGLTLGGAAVGAEIGGPFGAAAGSEIGSELGSGLTATNMSKNALIERAFQQSFTSPPIMSVQGVRGPSAAAGGSATAPALSARAMRRLPPASLPPAGEP